MSDTNFYSSDRPDPASIPPTHPAIKTLTAVVGIGFLLVLGMPYLEPLFSSESSRERGSEGYFPRKEGFPRFGMGREALQEPFKGITTDGKVISGLFPVQSTGVTTEPVRAAAEAFLDSLTPHQRVATTFPVDDPEWRDWMIDPSYPRKGISLRLMTDPQRAKALELARVTLSARGLKTITDILKLNHTLGEERDNLNEFDEDLYCFTVMGTPSRTEPWGWQLEGHHLFINYFVLGDQVVMTPTFLGSELAVGASGKYQGTEVLQAEQDKGLAFVNSLTRDQRKVAILELSKGGSETVAEAFKDNIVLDAAGIKASEFTALQQVQFLDLIEQYVGTMDDGHARIKLDEVRAHLDDTRFAWIGQRESDSVFYYRIQSPVIVIEFDHQSPGQHGGRGRRGAGGPPLDGPGGPPLDGPGGPPLDGPGRRPPGGRQDATRQHIHTVIRTPNGNDYGKDLLRQHFERHPQPD